MPTKIAGIEQSAESGIKSVPGELRFVSKPVDFRDDTRWADGLRGFAAFSVLIDHCVWISTSSFEHPPIWSYAIGCFGAMMVPLFIFLSGFLLGLKPAANGLVLPSFWKYIENRCNRLLPGYYASMLLWSIPIAIWVTHTWQLYNVVMLSPDFVGPLLLIHDFFGVAYHFNGPFWSLPVEFHCYFFMPIILLLFRKAGTYRGAAIFGLLSVIADHIAVEQGFVFARLYLYGVFALGVACAWHLANRRYIPSCKNAESMFYAGLALYASVWIVLDHSNDPSVLTPMTLSFLPAILSAFAWINSAPDAPIRLWLSSPKMAFLGRISYSLYLVHTPILFFIKEHTIFRYGYIPAAVQITALGVPLSLTVAWIFSRLFEEPYLRAKAKAKALRGVTVP